MRMCMMRLWWRCRKSYKGEGSFHDTAERADRSRYKLGDPADKTTTIGPVISAAAVKAISAQVDDALSKGAVDATPINASFQNLPATGSYVAPRLLTNVNHSMAVMTAETFGPLIPVMKVGSDEEAVALMNDSTYGLTASIWTRDVARGEAIGEDVEAGTLFVNRCDCPNPASFDVKKKSRCADTNVAIGSCVGGLEGFRSGLHPGAPCF